jgi:hypothetical protein
MLTLWLILKIADIPIKSGWILFLAWGASPALLSFSVAGYPYVTGFLPHALALWLVLNQRVCRNWLLSLVLCLGINELSWNLYELGKTVFVVYFAAAVLQRAAPRSTRVVWAVAAGIQLGSVMTWKRGNVGFFLPSEEIGVREILSNILGLGDHLFISQTLDIPVLFIIGVASVFFLRSNRLYLFLLFMFQVGLICLLAIKGMDMLRPRRFLMVEFYCVLLVAKMFRESHTFLRFGQIPKRVLIGLLLLGNVWQASNLIQFAKIPIQKQRDPMPYTYSQADYRVQAPAVDWYRELRSRVDAGEKLLLIYNFSAPQENSTDPAAVLERLYLYLGHEGFVNSVFAFGSDLNVGPRKRPPGAVQCRYSCLPIRSMAELYMLLDGIGSDSCMASEVFTVFYLLDQRGTYRHRFQLGSAKIFEEIRKRFLISFESPARSRWLRFKIERRRYRGSSGQGFVIEANKGTYYQGTNGRIGEESFLWLGVPIDIAWVEKISNAREQDSRFLRRRPWKKKPFSLEFSGTMHVREGGVYSFLLGSDDGALLSLNGEVIIDNSGRHRFQLAQHSLVLERGSYPFEIAYVDYGGQAHLLVDVHRVGDGGLQGKMHKGRMGHTSKGPGLASRTVATE